jgi:hypothetical protein
MMPLLSKLSYAEEDSFVSVLLNNYIIQYLPQLLELLRTREAPADLSTGVPDLGAPLALAA